MMTAKDLSALVTIVVRSNNERKSKRSATGVLGLSKGTNETDRERDVQTEKGVSFSQSEVSTPGPVTKKGINFE